MSRLAEYLGAVIALLLGALFIAFSGSVTVVRAPESLSAATSTPLLPSLALPITLPSLELKDETPTTSPAQTAPAPKKAPPAEKPAPKSTLPSSPAVEPQPAPAPAPLGSSGNIGLDASALILRSALVNILCYVPAGSRLHSISGSGIVVDPKGIVLTNAHIAQYFLLADRGASCSIRTGSPAADRYDAAPIYISPAWLRTNARLLTEDSPSGTGEYDYAFLAITKTATVTELPATFPSLPLAKSPPSSGTPVVIASYGAQFLESSQVQSSLFPTLVFGSVKDVFTFAMNTIDVLALGGSAAAQEGSSGGGVADASGELVGTITTSTVTGDTSTRSLDAITASYIRSAYAGETGRALDLLLGEPTASSVTAFAPKMPELEALLTAYLP